MKTKLITLQPLDTFFFGGENTFGEGEGANYFAASNLLPQQTTLLGMLRYLLFNEAKREYGVSADTEGYIGKESFRADSVNQSFGKIHSLSPVFIKHSPSGTKNSVSLFPPPFYLNYKREVMQLYAYPQTSVFLGYANEWQEAKLASRYDPKEGSLTDCWLGDDGEFYKVDNLFQSSMRVGITKNHLDEMDNQGFYKQVSYRMNNAIFAFFASFEDNFDPTNLDEKIVTLGGEKSTFILRIHATTETYNTLAESVYSKFEYPDDRLVLLTSDTYVESEVYEHCQFAITDTVDFRNIHTPSKTKNYSAMSRGESAENLYKSGKYNLLKRGSVLFPKSIVEPNEEDSLTAIQHQIEQAANFAKIGYNHFITFTNS
ncbi:MAG: type III-B CRISPR module-associated Cmr3 family protein [Bacteroidota bacterium]